MDWEEGRLQVEAELRAAGYRIEPQASAAREPSALLDELTREPEARGSRGPWTASMTVIRVGATGIAYVYLPGEDRVVRVLGSRDSPSVAAGALALRVFETVSIRAQASPKEPPAGPPAIAPTDAEKPPRPRWLLLGAGLLWPSFSTKPAGELRLLSSFPLGQRLRLEPEAGVSFYGAEKEVSAGTLTAFQHHLGVQLAAEWPLGHRLDLSVSGGAGAHCYSLVGDGMATNQAFQCVFSPSAGLRLLLSTRPIAGWLRLGAGLGLPVVRLTNTGQEPVDLGTPWMGLSAGVGVPF
jgi:hypothetical protein